MRWISETRILIDWEQTGELPPSPSFYTSATCQGSNLGSATYCVNLGNILTIIVVTILLQIHDQKVLVINGESSLLLVDLFLGIQEFPGIFKGLFPKPGYWAADNPEILAGQNAESWETHDLLILWH